MRTAKRRYSISASENDSIPVIACFDKEAGPARKTYLSVLACDSCNTQVLANNFSMPFCPCCASDEMHPVSDDLMENTSKQVAAMKPIAHCAECNTVMASPQESIASLDDNAMYCLSCSSLAKPIVADDDEEEDENENDSDSSEDEDMTDTVDDDSDNLFNNEEGEGGESDDSSTEDSNDSSSEETSDSSTEEAPADDSDAGSSLNANLVKMMAGKGGSASVVASPDRSKWYLFVDNVPVAVSSKDAASENVQGLFNTDKFVTAWEAATSDGVTEDSLGDFGFAAINTSVPVDEAVKQTVEAAIEEKTKKLNLTAKDISDRFQRCFGIAAVGINKNVFKEENPVKDTLVTAFTSRRVRDAERVISASFEQHGEQFLKNIALKASELMEKSDETLDELAEMVDEAKYDKLSDDKPAKPSVVSLFPQKVEEVEYKEEKVEIAASDIGVDPYDNILSGASFRS